MEKKPKLPTPKFKIGDNVMVTTSEFLTVFGSIRRATLQTKGEVKEWTYYLDGFEPGYAESSLNKSHEAPKETPPPPKARAERYQ